MFALVTDQGTAASEAALCWMHVDDPVANINARKQARAAGDIPDPFGAQFIDCTGNDALRCYVCGNDYHEAARIMRVREDDRLRQIEQASTPDPDAPPCEFCKGGLAHYPECPVVQR